MVGLQQNSSARHLFEPPNVAGRARDFYLLVDHLAVQDHPSNCELPIFLPFESNRGARNVTSSVCHSPAGRAAFTRGAMPSSM